MLRNPVYLGQARSGKVTKEGAHEPLVTRAEFDAVQVSRSVLKTRDGSIASQAMLGGLARCAGCGHTLKIAGTTSRKSGERYPTYYCTGRYAKGMCPSRAAARASRLDEHVEGLVLRALQSEDGLLAQGVAASEGVERSSRAVEEAEHELDLFVNNPKLLSCWASRSSSRVLRFGSGRSTRRGRSSPKRAHKAPSLRNSETATSCAHGRR